MTLRTGLGGWIAFESVLPIDRAIERAQSIGCAWVAPRAGQDARGDPGLTDANLARYLDMYGVEGVAPWIFATHCHDVAPWRSLYDRGVRCFVINAEQRFKQVSDDAARAWVARIREACPDVWIAHAPFALPVSHRDFPYLGLDSCDAVMSQLYPHEFGGGSAAYWWGRYVSEWARRPDLAHAHRCTILDTYGSERLVAMGAPPGGCAPFSLDVFTDLFREVEGERWPSLYSLEAMDGRALEWLESRARGQRVRAELGAAVPPAWEPQTSAATVLPDIVGGQGGRE